MKETDLAAAVEEELADLRRRLNLAIELIDDLRGYTREWDWKYGEEWDDAIKEVNTGRTLNP